MTWTRRDVIRTAASAAAWTALQPTTTAFSSTARTTPQFMQRGYYITFMRAPLFTFETWKMIFDDVHQDGGNTILLWMGGAFRSKKFPITWQYNAEHENVKHNFAGALIDYGHSLGMKVMLGLTPYAYDGVNQYALEHPYLKGISLDGNYTRESGLDAWGFNLNPWRLEAEQFMLDYTREMLEFYPNADGLLLESSDYAIAYCPTCPETYYQKEFQFIRLISSELWARKPDATIIVYPHYFSGAEVPGLNIKAAREEFDPRWTLFFTPHSTHLDPALVRRARSSIYWDPSPTFGHPQWIQRAAQTARQAGVTGFVPSMEPWNYRFSGPDMGAQFLVGSRCAPFGQGWLAPGELPTRTLLMRLNRLAYREYSRNPDLDLQDFRGMISRELFAGAASASLLDDLFFLEDSFFLDRTWDSTAAIASADYVKGRLDLGQLGPAKLADYQSRRTRIAGIKKNYSASRKAGLREMAEIASWIISNWDRSAYRNILQDHLR